VDDLASIPYKVMVAKNQGLRGQVCQPKLQVHVHQFEGVEQCPERSDGESKVFVDIETGELFANA